MTVIKLPYINEDTFKSILQLALLNGDEVQTVYDDTGIPNTRYISTAGHGYLVSVLDHRLLKGDVGDLYRSVRQALQENRNIDMPHDILIAEEDCDYPLLLLLLHIVYRGAIEPLTKEQLDMLIKGASAYRNINFLPVIWSMAGKLRS